MSIGAPRRPRRYKVFDGPSPGAAQRRISGTGGRSNGTECMVAGWKTIPPTAPQAIENFFKLFLGRDAHFEKRKGPAKVIRRAFDVSVP